MNPFLDAAHISPGSFSIKTELTVIMYFLGLGIWGDLTELLSCDRLRYCRYICLFVHCRAIIQIDETEALT
mgnify:CR=1 FL=1